jgi:hypothetical protein
MALTCQLPQKFLFVHVIFEGLAPIDEHDWHFVIELSPKLAVGIYVHFVPGETAAAGEFHKAFLHHFAQVTAFARINHDLARLWHAAIVPLPHDPISREKKNRSPGSEWPVPVWHQAQE